MFNVFIFTISPPSFSHRLCHDDGDEEAGRVGAEHHRRGLHGCWVGDESCLDNVMRGIIQISRYRTIELQKIVLIDLGFFWFKSFSNHDNKASGWHIIYNYKGWKIQNVLNVSSSVCHTCNNYRCYISKCQPNVAFY